jgi:ankyrin repeat protein
MEVNMKKSTYLLALAFFSLSEKEIFGSDIEIPPLVEAIKRGEDFETIRAFIETPETNVDEGTDGGFTPLMLSVMKNQEKVVKLLIENNADPLRTRVPQKWCVF